MDPHPNWPRLSAGHTQFKEFSRSRKEKKRSKTGNGEKPDRKQRRTMEETKET